ncbi:hypothetical protein [Pseudochrobactrum asaccharolyticum]|uniref:Uncharacterized protein n=1 Tax=Pseudochrobactrum asaccharolyticum TaxID=354351 RepID=A0A366DRG3_9HYPH|nr:hypothetical protein [Pseudochrobactrum asaccharolyticum]RBO91864.1 hypothetical protein DFR47_1085 [Pseudochrobactrum asaccharolyticum]
MTALDMFRMGKDTLDIAAATGRSEAEIERLIHAERTAQINNFKRMRQAAR